MPSGGNTQGRIVSVESSKATTNRFVGIVPLYYLDITVTGDPDKKPLAGELMTGSAHGYTANIWIAPATWTGVVRCYFYNVSSAAFTAENVSFSGGGTGTVPYYMAQAYTAYCVDIKTGALIWGSSPTFINGSAILGAYNAGKKGPVFAHGYVWFYAGTNIVRLNPATGTVTTAKPVTAAGGLQWVGDVLYYWDNTTKHIFSVLKADFGSLTEPCYQRHVEAVSEDWWG